VRIAGTAGLDGIAAVAVFARRSVKAPVGARLVGRGRLPRDGERDQERERDSHRARFGCDQRATPKCARHRYAVWTTCSRRRTPQREGAVTRRDPATPRPTAAAGMLLAIPPTARSKR
jgi:hypothetical protein